jgi:hypothetical protein
VFQLPAISRTVFYKARAGKFLAGNTDALGLNFRISWTDTGAGHPPHLPFLEFQLVPLCQTDSSCRNQTLFQHPMCNIKSVERHLDLHLDIDQAIELSIRSLLFYRLRTLSLHDIVRDTYRSPQDMNLPISSPPSTYASSPSTSTSNSRSGALLDRCHHAILPLLCYFSHHVGYIPSRCCCHLHYDRLRGEPDSATHALHETADLNCHPRRVSYAY